MTPHVAPHRWADLWAGKVGDAERSQMEVHADGCRACARTRQRVTRASDSFVSIRSQSAPEVPWDSIRARVHWSVSTSRRAALRQRPPAWGWLIGATVAGVVAALASGTSAPVSAPVAVMPLAAPVVASVAAPAAALVGLVSRASGDVMIDGVRPGDLFARAVGPGNILATGEGRVDVQFGDKSAFALGPRSTLELRRFDAHTIELAVDGTVDLAVAPRAEGQRFLVAAGDHVIEVRGTQFRVVRENGAVSVSCRHGLVAVGDPDRGDKVMVSAERRLHIPSGAPVSSSQVVPLTADELAVLVHATPLALPLWDPALAQSSAPLEIATSGRRNVRVDGVELGLAPLRVRVMPGRHTVEAADAAGRFRRAGWVDVAAAHGARVDVPAEPPASNSITDRRRQLRAGIDQPRLARCMRSIAKAGLTDTYVQIELSVDPQGAVGFLNVIDTDLPSETASCVREVLADVRFRAGAAATWRERIDL